MFPVMRDLIYPPLVYLKSGCRKKSNILSTFGKIIMLRHRFDEMSVADFLLIKNRQHSCDNRH